MITQLPQQQILEGAVFANFWITTLRQVLSLKKWTLDNSFILGSQKN